MIEAGWERASKRARAVRERGKRGARVCGLQRDRDKAAEGDRGMGDGDLGASDRRMAIWKHQTGGWRQGRRDGEHRGGGWFRRQAGMKRM